MKQKKKPYRFVRFEHRSENVLPYHKFILRVSKFTLLALLIITVSIGMGTLGYHVFGRLSWIDGFYNASMILTGMGPVSEMKTTVAKLFSSFYALYSGIAFLSTTAIFFSPIAHRILHILHRGND
jgi:hypothetical protein